MLSFIVMRSFGAHARQTGSEVKVSHAAPQRFARSAVALTLAGVMLLPATAIAAPATLESKKAERDRVKTELAEMKTTFDKQTAEYVRLCQRLDNARVEVDRVNAEIVQMDGQLRDAEDAFTRRAVQIYRRDNGGLIELLLSSRDIEDFMKRTYYLMVIGESDAGAITRLRQARSESLWLHQSLRNRVTELQRLQKEADDSLERIEAAVEDAEKKAESIEEDIAALMAAATSTQVFSGSEPGGAFNPEIIISEAKFRNATPMSVAEIQAFLESQPGKLATYRGKDRAGESKSAAEMIFDAANAYNISPTVLLVKLQKEQSLLADSTPTQRQLDWALGVGKLDGGRTLHKYQGFGNQVWYGAKSLDTNSRPWVPGITMTIDGSQIGPANSATYSLYKYTPHYRGNRSFWMLYWRYFGDPL